MLYLLNINLKILENLNNILKFKLFKIIYKINYKYIKIYILKKSYIDIILNFKNIRRY